MSTIFCNACNTENHSNSAKCEQCKTTLSSQENPNLMHVDDECENDFLYIENAEVKGQIFKLENLEEIDTSKLGIETIPITTINDQIVQGIKEEPEFQIEPDDNDFLVEEEIFPVVDTKKQPYQCSECNKCFKRKASLLSHKNTEHLLNSSDPENPDEPPSREAIPISDSQDKNTESSSRILILKCDFCNESFANSNELAAHQNQCIQKEKFHCDVCNIFVSNKNALYKHKQSLQHNNKLNNPRTEDNSKYVCSFCGENFKRKASLLSHTKTFHCLSDGSDVESSDTTATTQHSTVISRTSPKASTQHLKYQDKNESTQATQPHIVTLKCDLCNDSFANSNELNVHRSICITKEKFFCDVCKIFLSSKSALHKHKQSKQHAYYLDNSPKEGDQLKFVCLFCGERFFLQVLLTNHKKIHAEESKLLSETSRIERVDGRITYTCTICGKSTSNKSGHTEHLRVHTKEKPVKCDLCGSAFTTRSSLVRHMTLHTDERPYKCNICENTYRHKRNLRKHLFMHTGQRPYKCKYCDKTFALRFTFSDHVRLHRGETPYQCEECKESFKTSYLLNFHRRREHNIDTNTKPKVKILNKNVKSTQSTEEN